MAEFLIDKEIDADIQSAWTVLVDFGDVSWVPGMENRGVEGAAGVGQVRKAALGPIEVHERLEHFDAAARSLSYAIVQGPLPIENYLATVTLSEVGAGRTRVQWGARFDAPGLDDEASEGHRRRRRALVRGHGRRAGRRRQAIRAPERCTKATAPH